ncbi:2-C-methyl-D-erythritol 4-phosphate cytidylyltransferase [Haloferula helveola]|uniref:2-C-methyl-D-erythritol 4-phosphate cytidylyltransferase n=1 Tax=Haloferula helveola TaxID=490095 RepID=A0ABN6HAI3_9BACT|nr:2-C-methyl-D-erythritol 4-phosphate cytidylyltransferase [Haloferula helveola]
MGCAGVIVASGSSRRMGFDKLAAPLAGKPVLRRSLEALLAVPEITRVIVVCGEERFDDLLRGDHPKPVLRVDGGAERQDSVYAGLSAVKASEELVAVHDGARPLVDPGDISACIAAAREHGAASLGRTVTETLKRTDADGLVLGGLDRSNLWFTETPQVFRTDLLLEAYRQVREQGLVVTDEVSAMEPMGIATRMIQSTRPNPKITVPADLEAAHALLA